MRTPLRGREGNDRLTGNSGADVLDGGDGRDRITGGLGQDTLTGGAGRDTFQFTRLQDSISSGNRDVIADFVAGQDFVDLTSLGLTSIIGNVAFTGIAGQVRFAQNQNSDVSACRCRRQQDLRHDHRLDRASQFSSR